MKTLMDLAKTLRSKNAGPLYLTLDIIFPGPEEYRLILAKNIVTPQSMAALYGVSPEQVRVIPYEVVHAIKITLPRRHISGSMDDDDIYGCQQHMPLAQTAVPD